LGGTRAHGLTLPGARAGGQFAIITIFVGSNAWDTRLASRVCHMFELCEAAIVIGLLWIPRDAVLQSSSDAHGQVLNTNLVELQARSVLPPLLLPPLLLPPLLLRRGR
jgi:hypothetical protein